MSEMVVGRTYRRHNNNLSGFCPLSGLDDSFFISIYDIIPGLRELIDIILIIRDPVYLITDKGQCKYIEGVDNSMEELLNLVIPKSLFVVRRF